MKTIPLIGYADPLSGRPGDTIEFKASNTLNLPVSAYLSRSICADPNPDGPGIVEQHIISDIETTYNISEQPFYPGSFALAPIQPACFESGSFTLIANIWPTLITSKPQTIVALSGKTEGISLCINGSGKLCAMRSTHDGLESLCYLDETVTLKKWRRVWVSYCHIRKVIHIGQIEINKIDAKPQTLCMEISSIKPGQFTQTSIAASLVGPANYHYNGKIERPALMSTALDSKQTSTIALETSCLDDDALVSMWDFSKEISTTQIIDIGPAKAHGHIVNLPTRGVMGSNWTGEERNWTHRPDQYGAIHFHDDDIYDFDWQTSFSYTIPDNLDSGVYGVNLECGGFLDNIPFFVCAPKQKPHSKLCVLVSTFTYAIYGNHARPDFEPSWLNRFSDEGAYPWNPAEYRDYGLSTYNVHRDGSGISHASHLRPLLNLRPGYVTFGNTPCSGLRHFQADSHLIAWLEHTGIDYDLITDQQLHNEGVDAIAKYQTVMTGSHPEYHTPTMLDSLSDYRQSGGNLIYLGGNGFYWKIAQHREFEGTLEVRRAEGGIRAWASEPGEYYQAFDGEYGGLWRRNNRPPQALAGIGFSAQGKFTGSYYRRTEASYNDRKIAWIFEGINDEILGDFGLCGNGAAGFELDRVDQSLGSDPTTIILASSENHDADFVLVPEEQLTHITNIPGEPETSLIRADMIYQKNEHGSEIFSTGSITFCGSLLVNNGDNNISALLRNVVQKFCK